MTGIPGADERRRFQAAQSGVAEAARGSDAARLSVLAAREALDRARRAGNAQPAHEQRVVAATRANSDQTAAFDARWKDFAAFSDPRSNVQQLDDATPLLLFPLRLETRFGLVLSTTTGLELQLWVRVYPDDCLIDSFQSLPSETEIASTRRYWRDMWKARGIEALERGAWRSLVASHGSGRAAWLEAHYRPLNYATKPNNPAANALILVIVTETPLGDLEASRLKAFWKDVWMAAGQRAKLDQARAAFDAAMGDLVRAGQLIKDYEPANLTDEPPLDLPRDQVDLSVAFIEFPKSGDQDAAKRSWSEPARSRLLPDRFMLLGYANGQKVIEALGAPIPWPLPVGPDPQAPEVDQIRQENGEVKVGADLQWLIDFDRAVQIGMGFRVKLTAAQHAAGFDKLLVLGVRLSANAQVSRGLLEELLSHHRDGSSGFALVRQGTPTNNTEDESSGFTRSEEADRMFDERLHPGADLRSTAPWNDKLDGEWLADALGIDPKILNAVGGSRNTDQLEAQAMNTALWPATIGYMLETMMHPLFDGGDIDRVRWFYERFVSGRGLLPAIRIGRQPYGLVPTTVLSRLRWTQRTDLGAVPGADNPPGFRNTIAALDNVLRIIAGDWAQMAQGVIRINSPGDPHHTLLNILGLNPASVEYWQRYAESVDDLYNRMRFYGAGAEFMAELQKSAYQSGGMELLRRLGYAGDAIPDILNHLFLDANTLQGPVVDDVPLSESTGLQKVTPEPWNYIEWLRDAAATSLEKLRAETGFTGGTPPKAILYLYLRHALLQAYWDASLRLRVERNVMDAAGAKAARHESPFIHVRQEPQWGESRWRALYEKNAALTGGGNTLVGDYVTGVIGVEPAASRLKDILAALDVLKNLPTARLERLFAEHIDTCAYRLDAWQQGLVQYGLTLARYTAEREGVISKKGIFLGAVGYLEDVRVRARRLDAVPPPPGVDPSFFAPNLSPLAHDPSNGGYILAPSLNQAITGAVLRNGYIANANAQHPETFAINLSSQRVRTALSFLEGVRQGQSLGALLGYQLERGLHDNYGLGEVDEHIYALRKKFPLVADRNPETASAPTDPIETVEAKNVVDGRRLVEYVQKLQPPRGYPWGFTDLPSGAGGKGTSIDREVDRLLDITDAIADLKVADSVYHAIQSNYDAVAATLDSSCSGQLPVEPAVIKTPRSGRTITHRVALHLEAGLAEDVSPVAAIPVTPRARAEPALNTWLAGLLPAADSIACTVTWFDSGGNALQSRKVTQEDLALQPIDLLYIASLETSQAMSELDDRVLLYAHQHFVPRADSAVTIQYRSPIAGSVTFFELAPLVRSLRSLLLHSRPLRPTDEIPQGTAASRMDGLVKVKPERITKVQTALTTLGNDVVAFRDALAPLHADPPNGAQIIAGVSQRLDAFAVLLARAASFGIGDTGWGFILDFKRDWFASVLTIVRDLANRFTTRLAECVARLAAYDAAQAGMTDPERVSALAGAERYVRATITIPPPAPVAYRTAVGNARTAFANRLTQLRNILTLTTQDIGVLRQAVRAALDGPPSVSNLDPQAVSLADSDDALVHASADLLARAKRLVKAIQDARLTPVAALITQHNASGVTADQARLLTEAAKLLLGPDAMLIPEFQLDDERGKAFQTAYNAAVAGNPLVFQRTTKQTPEPLDTWLYGVARVREKLRQWEQTVMLAGAFGPEALDLLPVQVPWKAGEHWLGLEYPAGYAPDGDRLCYTAHFAKPFDATKWQCGLALDDWTEVVPSLQETAGLAFHFDRPNAEAPQALLLVTPPDFTGAWQWQDIVDAVLETFERCKSRLVEPYHIEETTYPRFLPMTVMAASLYAISIVTDLARNNDVFVHLQEAAHG